MTWCIAIKKRHNLFCSAQAKKSWNNNNNEGCTLEELFLDPKVPLSYEEKADPKFLSRLWSCIEIGLLCVQESPNKRPDIEQVVEMLKTEGELSEPEEPTLREEGERSNARPEPEEPIFKGETSNTRSKDDDIERKLIFL